VSITPGISEAGMPAGNRLEEIWQRHYAAIFNPARLGAKRSRNLPEALTIKPTSESADDSGSARTDHAEPHMVEPDMTRRTGDRLGALRAEAADCRACHLYKHATQTVFGEGPQSAQVVLVGEQPGDKEDLAGKPFVGPAGLMLDRALDEAGIDRKKVYITNAVKHFKFVPRGKIRLHQKPNTPEIKACRQWYERELASIKPDLVVAMGATAAQCVFNKLTPINKNRGRLIDLADDVKALVTVHPSYLLRLPDPDSKEREYQRFVEDLKIAAELLRKRAQAAA
jgi:DNA polymerase